MTDSPDPTAPSGGPREAESGSRIRIGEWLFSPGEASLARGDERVRLEHRAAEVLALLARQAGSPVTAATIVAQVWGGRSVSPNSVAVVIADLRRALGDDVRQPQYIETIPKRGYRLLAPVDGATAPQARQLSPGIRRAGLVLFAVAAALLLFLLLPGHDRRPIIFVAPFVNATSDPTAAPLAPASRELVTTSLGRIDAVRLVPDARDGAFVLSGRLIRWSGHPALSLALTDTQRGTVRWTGMAGGPEGQLPRQVPAVLRTLQAAVEAGRLGPD